MTWLSNCCSVLWTMIFLLVCDNGVSLATQMRMKRNRFFEVTKPTNKWPSRIWETEEDRKTEALKLCMNRDLNVEQRKICLKFPLQVAAVFRGYQEAVEECQYQFRNKRWNCSSLMSMRDTTVQPLLNVLMTRSFKEVAFVHALVAAAVAKTVSVDCARGVITSCDRAGSKRRRSKKRYVSHNEAITHGIYFSEKFLNSGRSIHDVQGSVNRHNLRAGRLLFTNTLKTVCKCHGATGSCTVKTCFQRASGLRLIGNTLKTMFNNARKVEPANQKREGVKLVLVDDRKSPKGIQISPKKTELLYTENSPSFCQRDDTLGIPGVSHRICSKDPSDANSCSTLCCGTGYNQYLVRKESSCECKFKYCCFTQCKKCSERKLITACR